VQNTKKTFTVNPSMEQYAAVCLDMRLCIDVVKLQILSLPL